MFLINEIIQSYFHDFIAQIQLNIIQLKVINEFFIERSNSFIINLFINFIDIFKPFMFHGLFESDSLFGIDL